MESCPLEQSSDDVAIPATEGFWRPPEADVVDPWTGEAPVFMETVEETFDVPVLPEVHAKPVVVDDTTALIAEEITEDFVPVPTADELVDVSMIEAPREDADMLGVLGADSTLVTTPVLSDVPWIGAPVGPVQYTPEYRSGGVGGAAVIRAGIKAANDKGNRHDPDGIVWLQPAHWEEAKWDGVPYTDYENMSRGALCKAIFPNSNTMRGLREHFYAVQPFKDNQNPTVAEIDAWNIEVVRHFRRLLGITIPIEPDRCLFLRAQWATERKATDVWDAKYPGTFSTAYGPCGEGSIPHCGAAFAPNEEDQVPYGAGEYCPHKGGGTEGIGGTNQDIPWSIKLGRVIAMFLCLEGIRGHTGPFLTRQRAGFAWHNIGKYDQFRGKWH